MIFSTTTYITTNAANLSLSGSGAESLVNGKLTTRNNTTINKSNQTPVWLWRQLLAVQLCEKIRYSSHKTIQDVQLEHSNNDDVAWASINWYTQLVRLVLHLIPSAPSSVLTYAFQK